MPVPVTAPQVARPQLLCAVHPFPQLEQLIVFAVVWAVPESSGLVVLSELEIALTTANPPITSKPIIIEAIIHAFILFFFNLLFDLIHLPGLSLRQGLLQEILQKFLIEVFSLLKPMKNHNIF